MSRPLEDPSTLDEVAHLVDLAIREDVGRGDVTSETLFNENHRSDAVVVVRERGVVAGVPVFRLVYERLSREVDCEGLVDEGEWVEAGTEVVRLKGPTIALLKGERTALNFLQRLSGIATRTRRLVDRLSGSGIVLLDTRKTTPGHRILEKYAVRIGGGENHRLDLSGMILVKENHIAAAGGVNEALEAITGARDQGKGIEIEVRNLEELEKALNFQIERVMLDNFTPEGVREAVSRIDYLAEGRKRPEIEVSGGIGDDNIDDYRIDGIDYISVGSLTHSVRALDISMIIEGGSW